MSETPDGSDADSRPATADAPGADGSSMVRRVGHPLVVGLVTAAFAQVATMAVVVAAFSTPVALAVVVVAVPIVYVVMLCVVTRATSGRARWLVNLVIAGVVIALGVTIALSDAQAPLFGGVPALPLTLGIAAGVSSFVVLPRFAAIVGLAALAAQLVVVAAPQVESGMRDQQAAVAADAAELDRRLAVNTRPYVVPGLTLRIALFSDDETVVQFSDDAGAATDERYTPDAADLTVRTAPLVAGQGLESEVCRWVLDADAGGSPANSCVETGPGLWVIVVHGEHSVVRIIDGSRVELGGGGRDEAALLALADTLQPMAPEEFERRNRWSFERDQRA